MSLYHSVRSFALALTAVACGVSGLFAGSPELVVKEFSKTGTPSWHDGKLQIPVRFRIENQGTGSAAIQFVNLIKVNGKDRWSGFMNPLSPGESMTVNTVVKVPDPNKLLSGRTLQLLLHADAPLAAADTSIPPYGRIDESNDDNNTKTLNVQIPSGIGGIQGGSTTSPGAGPSRPMGLKGAEAVRVPRFLDKKGL